MVRYFLYLNFNELGHRFALRTKTSMKKRINKLVAALISMAFLSCTNSSDLMDIGDLEPMSEESTEASFAPKDQISTENQYAKKVIKNGGIVFESKNYKKDYEKVISTLASYQAYIENENLSNSTSRIHYNLTIRVPANLYDSLLDAIGNMAYRIENRYSNVEDVTRQYYDLSARISNKKALEDRYLTLLEKASIMKDLLEIESKLNEVRIEIEQLEGQFKYLSKKIAMSTLTVSFYEQLPYVYDSSGRKGFLARILSALDGGWQGFLTFLVAVFSLWPFIIIAVFGIFLIRKYRNKIRMKKQPKPKTNLES